MTEQLHCQLLGVVPPPLHLIEIWLSPENKAFPGDFPIQAILVFQSHVAVGGSSSLFLTRAHSVDPHSLTNPPIVSLPSGYITVLLASQLSLDLNSFYHF